MRGAKLIFGLMIAMISVAATIDLNNLDDYEAQLVPNYIQRDNGTNNPQNNEKATLGRVLFYDKALSLNNTVACASCHIQAFAFSDTALTSVGFDGGLTDRHSMRLVNSRFGQSETFFWDNRANTLEDQTSEPIQNFVEMGFSGQNGQPDLDSLIRKMEAIAYYPLLFEFVYGDDEITESRIQLAIANFVRSIQSFDSKFDQGLAQTGNMNAPFPNYTQEENEGKNLFLSPIGQGGASCQSCHRAPEFDIAPNILNNGIIGVANDPNGEDLTNHRSPSLRDLFNPAGELNGPLMHNGEFDDIQGVINHYNNIEESNPQLDPHLFGPGQVPQNLGLTQAEKLALGAFLRTLTGSSLYTNPLYADPFDANGSIEVIPSTAGVVLLPSTPSVQVYPNPANNFIRLNGASGYSELFVFDLSGKIMLQKSINQSGSGTSIEELRSGNYLILIRGNGLQDQKMKLQVQKTGN